MCGSRFRFTLLSTLALACVSSDHETELADGARDPVSDSDDDDDGSGESGESTGDLPAIPDRCQECTDEGSSGESEGSSAAGESDSGESEGESSTGGEEDPHFMEACEAPMETISSCTKEPPGECTTPTQCAEEATALYQCVAALDCSEYWQWVDGSEHCAAEEVELYACQHNCEGMPECRPTACEYDCEAQVIDAIDACDGLNWQCIDLEVSAACDILEHWEEVDAACAPALANGLPCDEIPTLAGVCP